MRKAVLLIICGILVITLITGATRYGLSVARRGKEATNYYKLGVTFYERGKFKEAAKLFEMIINEYPSSNRREGAMWYLGNCLKELKMEKEAKGVWEKMIDEYPQGRFLAEAYYELGEYLRCVEGDIEGANQLYIKAATPMALFRLGEYHLRKGNMEMAKRYCVEALLKETDEAKKDKIRTTLGKINMDLLTSIAFTPKSQVYVVKRGDTLSGIAKRFNMSVELLKECNGLNDDLIKPHQRLKVVKMDYRIVVDKEKNTMRLMADGEFFTQYRIATGIRTPTGKFRIASKLRDPVWYAHNRVVKPGDPANVIGKIWIGFDIPGYGIHGTKDPNEIGKTITKGCIRMREEDIEELFKIIPLGTEVQIVEGVS
jgi:lipoprotein-anchoring transpeptidase ErfK/SrfK